MQGAGASQHRPASLRTQLPRQDSNLNKENQNQNALQSNSNSESTLGYDCRAVELRCAERLLILMCLSGPQLNPPRRQAFASSVVVEAGLLVPPQPTGHGPGEAG